MRRGCTRGEVGQQGASKGLLVVATWRRVCAHEVIWRRHYYHALLPRVPGANQLLPCTDPYAFVYSWLNARHTCTQATTRTCC